MTEPIKVTVWNEFRHEKQNSHVKSLYPEGIHGALMSYLGSQPDIEARGATLEEPEHGLTDDVLADTDVMLWWGHMAHAEVDDRIVSKVHQRVLSGMGLIVLHSAHYAKIFRRLMGSNCSLKWRAAGEKERLWNVAPGHPITQGIGEYLELEKAEMYGERFDIPEPDQLIFISWFEGGEVFRSGATWNRGNGKVFYFRPGHETYPIYHNKEVLKVIENAVRWARPLVNAGTEDALCAEALEKIEREKP